MITFRDISEKAGDTAVFTFGRFNPPTTGHEKLIDAMAMQQKRNSGAKMFVYASHSADPKKNPLPHSKKVAYMRAMFPKYKAALIVSKAKTAIEVAVELHNKGFRSLVMVVGSDRVTEFDTLLNKYNGVEARHGYYGFDNIEVASAGERDPDGEGVAGMSASKMRAAAVENNFSAFETGLPKGFRDSRKLYNDVRKNMGIREEKDMGEMTDFEACRDAYLTGKLWNIGDVVEANGIVGEVVNRGTNYLTFSEENGKVHKVWLYQIEINERNYAKEYANYGSRPEQIARRSSRNKARRLMGDKAVKGMDVGHKDNDPMNNDPSNLKNEDPSDNRREPRLREVKQDTDVKDKDGTQPSKYYAGDMAKSTKDKRDAHFKKKKAGPAPGDASAKTKPSTHTQKFKQMYGEVLGKAADQGDYIDDFKKSDAPQFKGKSKEKRKDMAIAAYLDKKEDFTHYPGQVDPKTDQKDGDWIKGDPPEPIIFDGSDTKSILDKANKEVEKERGVKVKPFVVEDFVLNEKIEGLVTKAEKSGMPYGILKKVYDRGMAAWKTGHRPGTTPQQWAFARVNSFVTKSSGTWGKADKDLAKQVNSSYQPEEVKLDEKMDPFTKVLRKNKKMFDNELGNSSKDYKAYVIIDDEDLTDLSTMESERIFISLKKNKGVGYAEADMTSYFKTEKDAEQFVKDLGGPRYNNGEFGRLDIVVTPLGRGIKKESMIPKKKADKESVQEWFEDQTNRAAYEMRYGDDWWWKLNETHDLMLEKIGACCDDCLEENVNEACWDGYKQVGMKKKGSKNVPNCVPESMTQEEFDEALVKVKGTSNLYEPRKKSKYSRAKGMMDYMKAKDKQDADKARGDKNKGNYKMRMYNSMENYWGEISEKDANSGKDLNNPTRGDVKKYKVYVKNDKGNVVKVEFGDPNMSIKRDDPERRKAFRARHGCDTPGPKWKAKYWSCKFWSSKSVTDLMKG